MTTALLAATVCSPQVIVLGYGDGSVANAISENPAKDVMVIRLPGDPPPERCDLTRAIISRIDSPEDAKPWALRAFASHTEIPNLAGTSIVDDHPLSPEAEEARKKIAPALRLALTDQPQLYGNDILDSFMGVYHGAFNAPTLLPGPTVTDIAGRYGPAPVVAIGAGPSLKRHIDELRALQDRCVLVACDAVLPGLLAEDIQPHFVTPLERLRANAVFSIPARGTRCFFAGLPVCHPDTLTPFEGRTLGVAGLDRLYDWMWPGAQSSLRIMTGSSTGVLAFSLALAVTRGPVYLVGHDLAKEAGNSHWKTDDLAAEDFKKMTQVTAFGAGYGKRMVPGNSGEMVESIDWWDRFRGEIALLTQAIGRTVYNVSAHDRIGAVIQGTKAAPLPKPEETPILPEMQWPERRPERLHAWRARAQKMPSDADHLIACMDRLRADIAHERTKPAHEWNVGALSDRMSISAGVTEDNVQAFSYLLRSALHNSLALHHADLFRCKNALRARWLTMDGVDVLASGVTQALLKLRPCLERIARV